MVSVLGHCAIVLARVFELLWYQLAALLEGYQLQSVNLSIRTKGVDKTLLTSCKGKELKAFVDGSVLESGACGFAVYYHDGHILNHSGRIDVGTGKRAESGLAELAALFWVLLHHPRGQHLSIFSDSMHALNVVKSMCSKESSVHTSKGVTRCPKLDPRERCLASAIWWLLRLRTAHTCFYKVPGHRGFKQNAIADALAQHAAANGVECAIPMQLSTVRTFIMLLFYLLNQSPLDGGVGESVSGRGPAGSDAPASQVLGRQHTIRRPEPLSTSCEVLEP